MERKIFDARSRSLFLRFEVKVTGKEPCLSLQLIVVILLDLLVGRQVLLGVKRVETDPFVVFSEKRINHGLGVLDLLQIIGVFLEGVGVEPLNIDWQVLEVRRTLMI